MAAVPSALLELAAHLAVQAGRGADAAHHLCEQARRALAAGAPGRAATAARRARQIAPAGHPEAIAAGEVLLEALDLAGDAATVQARGPEVLARLAADGASGDRRAAALLRLARSALAAPDLARARRLCEEALALAPRAARLRLRLDLTRAEIEFSEQRHAASLAGVEAVRAQAEAEGLDDVVCDSLCLLGRHVRDLQRERGEAERCFSGALARARQAGLPLCRLRALSRLASHDPGRPADLEALNEARAAAEELGALALTAELDHCTSLALLAAGRLDAAAACGDRALLAARRLGLGELAAVASDTRAAVDVLAALAEDDLDGAARRAADAHALLRGDGAGVDDGIVSFSLQVAQAIIAGRAGEVRRAGELFAEADANLAAAPRLRRCAAGARRRRP